LNISLRSSISYLYLSIICVIMLIFSSTLLSGVFALSGMQSYIVVNPCSSLSTCYFSSSFYEVVWAHLICSISMNPLPTSMLVAYAWALDCTSYITLAWSLYTSLVGICAVTTSNFSTSPMGFCVISLSNMFIWRVTINVSLPWTTNCIASSPSFCAGGCCVFSCCCVLAYGPA